jgi:hypothetical protein
MRVLEALKILEAAVRECEQRCIDTPGVREALDVLEPIAYQPCQIAGFRDNLRPCMAPSGFGPDLEGQQQVLRVYAGIYRSIRLRLYEEIGKLGGRYAKTKDETVKAEIDRLSGELAKLPERWEFYVRKD